MGVGRKRSADIISIGISAPDTRPCVKRSGSSQASSCTHGTTAASSKVLTSIQPWKRRSDKVTANQVAKGMTASSPAV